MTLFTTGSLFIEFTAGVWTDVSAYYDLLKGIEIKHGRPTEFDDVGPSTLTVHLWNDDGRFMPELMASPYYPNMVEGKRIRWQLTKGGVTYTRFQGWIQEILPDFPTDNTVGAQVHITASDSLALMGQRKLRSNATERVLYVARNASSWADAYEFAGTPNGVSPTATNYSNDASPGVPSALYGAGNPTPSFASDPDVTIGQIMSITPDSNGSSNHPLVYFQANPLYLHIMVKCPRNWVGSGISRTFGSFSDAAFVNYYNLVFKDNAGSNGISLYNTNLTVSLAFLRNAPLGQWVHIYLQQNAVVTKTDVWARELASGTTGASALNFDIRTIAHFEPAGAIGLYTDCSFGSIVAMGVNSPTDVVDLWTSATGGTVATRITSLQNACSQLPVTFATVGSATTTSVVPGTWSDRSALEVGQEVMRTGQGILWARGRDSQACWIASDQVRPSTPLVTIDVDADAWGAPTLTRATDSRPTRVEVTFPGGQAVARDATTEATGQIRSKAITTISADGLSAQVVGSALLSLATVGMRISQITVDLTSAVDDLTAALFSEASTISGLFPTCRVRVGNLPLTHFSAATRDAYVQGWAEKYDRDGVRVILDTTPAPASVLWSDPFTGTNGSGWAGAYALGVTATGGTVQIQTNRGRIGSGTVANGYTARRTSLSLAASDSTVTVRFVDSQATARVWARADSTLAVSGYYVQLDTTGTARLRVMSAGVSTDLATWAFSATTATDYGVRLRVADKYLHAKVWAGATEPGTWSASVTDTTFSAAGSLGLGVLGDATTTSRAVDFDNYSIADGS